MITPDQGFFSGSMPWYIVVAPSFRETKKSNFIIKNEGIIEGKIRINIVF
jgi:hypothetical protein